MIGCTAKSFGLPLFTKLIHACIYNANIVPKIKNHINLKRIWIITIVLVLIFSANYPLLAQRGTKIKTVVIDAGHGGKDPGALTKRVKEKDIVLSVALKTGKYIEENFKDVRVIYTRNTDKFIPLYERGAIANRNQADLFISIHCNANNNASIFGAETYVLGVEDKRSKLNMDAAMLENAAILLEEDASDQYGDFDPRSEESIINLTLFQSNYLDQSLNFAQKVQQQFSERVGRKDRSVHQAGFLVLWKTAMPSVLIELGYLSNAKEEAFLSSEKGQVYLASAIYRAFKEYKIEFEKENKAYAYREEILKTNPEPEIEKEEVKITTETPEVVYRVQFYASPKKLAPSDARLKGLPDLWFYEHNGLFKYTSGVFTSHQLAVKFQKEVRSKGFSDAFVVAFHNDKRVSIDEAQRLQQSNN